MINVPTRRLKQGIIIPICKEGDVTNCNNYRGITLSAAGKLETTKVFSKKGYGTKWNIQYKTIRPVSGQGEAHRIGYLQ